MAEGDTQFNEFGPPEGDLYIKAGGIRYLKVSKEGLLSSVNGGRLDANILMFPNGPIHGWTDAPFKVTDYVGATVEPGDVVTNRCARIGAVLNWILVVTGITTPGSPNSPAIRVRVPEGQKVLNECGGHVDCGSERDRDPTVRAEHAELAERHQPRRDSRPVHSARDDADGPVSDPCPARRTSTRSGNTGSTASNPRST
jgi:hypothetical protein